ncbi:hypothetical protein QQX98_008946 [Neonectria punicea]|uniref:Major facilitator superfamily (MFS) profile domain-containing protein n=1 Tax=Neonectria punicea TaxID=979145 RepID=A0ABR1GTQ9_9HYPO
MAKTRDYPHIDALETHLEDAQTANSRADVFPGNGKYWWQVPHLLKLNLLLLIPLITSYVSGFDGSMLNGMQSVPVWQQDFNHASGSALGVVSTSQTIGGVFCLPLAPYLTDKYGRRHPISLGSAILVLGAALQSAAVNIGMFIAGRVLVGIGIVVMIFVFFFFYNIAMNPIPMAYILEILPFTLRAKGITVFNLAQFSSSIFNGFVNPIALEAIGWEYYIVFACLVVVWTVVIWLFFPETRSKRYEEVAIIFDGPDSMQAVYDRTEKLAK